MCVGTLVLPVEFELANSKPQAGPYRISPSASALNEIIDKSKDAKNVEVLIKILREGKGISTVLRRSIISDVVGVKCGQGISIRAAEALGDIKDKRAVEPLIEVLRDEYFVIRKYACWALGEIGGVGAVDPLIEVLRGDSDNGVRKYAAEALGKIKDKRAVEPLTEALREDSDEFVRIVAARALGEIGDESAVETLGKVALNE